MNLTDQAIHDGASSRGCDVPSVCHDDRNAILVVDSDPATRGLISSCLRHLGHRVREADDAAGALQLASGGDTFDVVVTELNLRARGGVAMARELLDRGAASGILFMTDSVPIARALARSLGTGMFIARPFTADSLKHHIDEILRRNKRSRAHSSSGNLWARQRLRAIGSRANSSVWRNVERARVEPVYLGQPGDPAV